MLILHFIKVPKIFPANMTYFALNVIGIVKQVVKGQDTAWADIKNE